MCRVFLITDVADKSDNAAELRESSAPEAKLSAIVNFRTKLNNSSR